MPNTIRPLTTTFSFALGLLALTGCPDDEPGEDGTSSSTAGTDTGSTDTPTTTTGQTADTTGADTTAADTASSDTTDEPTTGGEATLLELIFDSVGGSKALDDLAQVQMETSGSRFIADEGLNPGDPAGAAGTFDTTVSVDFEQAGLRLDIVRTPTFFGTFPPFNVSEIVSGNLGYVQGLESIFGFPPEADMLSDRWASTVKLQRLLNPHFMLKELLEDSRGATEMGSEDFNDVEHLLLEVEDEVFPVTLWFDTEAQVVSRATTMENSHLHRDVDIDVRYLDWQETDDGVFFPNQVQLWIGGELIHDETRSEVTSNPELDASTFELPAASMGTFDADEAARGARTHQHNQAFLSVGLNLDGVQSFIQETELAPGVHHLTGGSHHSMIIEQENGVVLFEAPLYAERCEAILDWVDTNLMSPVTHVVLSHHHEDHSACARTVVAEGATLVVHEEAETFFQEVLDAASTIEPDALAEGMVMDPEILVVPTGGNLTLDDVTNPIGIYELESTHAADLVFPFVESAGAAFIVDIYSPGNPPLLPSGPQEVLDAFDAAGVTGDVNIIAGGHGGVGNLAELQAAASP